MLTDLTVVILGSRVTRSEPSWRGASVCRIKPSNCPAPDRNRMLDPLDIIRHPKKQDTRGWYQFMTKKNHTGWWCANRRHLGEANRCIQNGPRTTWILLIDDDTVVFTKKLSDLVVNLKTNESYIGHVLPNLYKHAPYNFFIGGGGGMVIRRHVFDRIDWFAYEQRQLYGDLQWWPSDWVIALAFHHEHIHPTAHPSFQQFAGSRFIFRHRKHACPLHAVTCHPFKTHQSQKKLLLAHARQEVQIPSSCSKRRDVWAFSACD